MTTNEPSVIDGYTVSRTIHINATIEKVWAAITEPKHLAQWFPQSATLEPAAVGARGAFTFEGYGTFPVVIEAVDAPRSISYRWGNDNAAPIPLEETSTVFTFTLSPVDDGTTLTVVETGFENLTDPAGSLEGNRGGWDFELDELVAYLEGPA